MLSRNDNNFKKQSDNREYQTYLRQVQSRQNTSEEVIRNIIKKATSSNLISKKRIIYGEVNEVYCVVTDDGSQFIVRISIEKPNSFLQEQWAIKESKKVGVPVPVIISIGSIVVDGNILEFCINRYMEGEVLDMGSVDFDLMDEENQKKYLYQAGEILTKIHSIKTSGIGKIDGTGASQHDTLDNFFSIWENEALRKKLANQIDYDLSAIENIGKTLVGFKHIYEKIEPRLNHGDYFPRHFVARNKKIIGILDWGEVRSDSPVYDFANWAAWIENPKYINWLKDGYSNKSLFNNNFDTLLRMIRLAIDLEVLNWYQSQKRIRIVERTKAKLFKDLKYFK